MNNWIILPVLLPAMTAAFLVLAVRYNLASQRILSTGACVVLLAAAVGLFILASDGVVRPLYVGAWPAPFGIVLVLDQLSALMLLLTSALAFIVLCFAMYGWDRRGPYFHPLFQFQLLGINGAFLTGDVFNLFVFFEVMLIASYGLMLHGGGRWRLKAGFHYVAINLIASTVFLFAVGLIYGVTGTLNMADLAVKVPQVAPGSEALLRTGAVLLFSVFAVKAALVPLHWWLPGAYGAASAPAAALFAIMTKVGAYSIIRFDTLVFGPQAGPLAGVIDPLLLPAALITLAVGAAGVLASTRLLDLVCFSVVASMGTLLIAVDRLDAPGLGAALYYLVHSTAISAALFLLVDVVASERGPAADTLRPAESVSRPMLYSGFFLLAGIAMVGMPPLSGFVGKLLILDATRNSAYVAATWSTILGASLIMLVGYARAGSTVFWAAAFDKPRVEATPTLTIPGPVLIIAILLATTALLSLFAGPVMAVADATARQLLEPAGYVSAVLEGSPATPASGGSP